MTFGNKEEYMAPFNDFIKNNVWRIERYFKSIVANVVTPTPTIDSAAATDSDFAYFHELLNSNKRLFLSNVIEEQARNKFKDLLETLEHYR
jgi:hypothetical protein